MIMSYSFSIRFLITGEKKTQKIFLPPLWIEFWLLQQPGLPFYNLSLLTETWQLFLSSGLKKGYETPSWLVLACGLHSMHSFMLLKWKLDFRIPPHLLAYELNVLFSMSRSLREEGNMEISERVFWNRSEMNQCWVLYKILSSLGDTIPEKT